MLSRLRSATILGIEAVMVEVEVDLSRGLPAFDIVGLPDTAVRESRERVRAAVKNSGYDFPVKRITINLAPADIKKIGPHYDLAVAAGILSANGILKEEKIKNYLFAGELSLTGDIRRVKGILPMVIKAREIGLDGVIIPEDNYNEGVLVEGINVFPVKNLKDVVNYFNYKKKLSVSKSEVETKQKEERKYKIDFAEVKGQQEAKRALIIAAAGSHNILMVGPPGSGKTMLAKRLRTILPDLTEEEALEITRIYSIMGMIGKEKNGLISSRPFRSPHHSISTAGLVGGGRIPEPGEVSLAHFGTLFLDELPEYHRDVLEMLRQPLEDGEVTIVRREMTATFPADFMLAAAMNPCPCGYYGDDRHECSCSITQINRYRAKVSGPLLDRIDIHIEVPALSVDEITGDIEVDENKKRLGSTEMCRQVIRAHEIQLSRYKNDKINFNSQLKGKMLERYCQLDLKSKSLLKTAIEQLGLSARAYDRVLRLARTIADLDDSESINVSHTAEAVQYRSLDRKIQ